MKNKYYDKLDLIRALSCISILLYHMNILKGGYLSVCTFFVLTGYLSVISAFKKENISIKKYYLNKLKRIYIPLIIVIFITITIISFMPNINWFNLKPETLSILLNYNNFWQLSANLDYFTRNNSSPFMHLWYMSIAMQFYIIFPLLFIILRRLGDKIKKIIPCIILAIISIFSYVFFYKELLNGNIMNAYYNTYLRLFSIFLGMMLGFINNYYKSLKQPNIIINKIIIYILIIFQLLLIVFIDARSKYFGISMLLTTIIALGLINYSIKATKKELTLYDKIIKFVSNISYEIYLIQYPVIFLFQNISINNYLKALIVIIITTILSIILHYAINIEKTSKKCSILKKTIFIMLLIPTAYGIYKFIIAKDYTKEMQALQEKLYQNKLLSEQKQNEYLKKIQSENEKWQIELDDLEKEEKNLREAIKKMPIVGIGDSIMLGAIDNLYQEFPNGYFDAAINRTDWEANDILANLKNRGLLSDIIVFNLGTNGECPDSCKNEIFNTIGNRKIFWVNATKPDYPIFNTNLKNLADTHDNIYIIDWISASNDHNEYFIADGIHLTKTGADAYAKAIYDGIYKEYLNELNERNNNKIKEHDKVELNKISFIGNSVLLNSYELFEHAYPDSEFIINEKFTYQQLYKELMNRENNNNLSYNVVIMLDDSVKLSKEEYQNIINLCKEHHIYIVFLSNIPDFENDNVTFINFYEEIKLHEDYLFADKIHLTNKGLSALLEMVNKELNKS